MNQVLASPNAKRLDRKVRTRAQRLEVTELRESRIAQGQNKKCKFCIAEIVKIMVIEIGHTHSSAEVEYLTNLCPPFEIPPLDLKLTDDEIHIWFVVLDQTDAELHRFMQTLSIDERMRADRFYFQKDRKWFISRHGILRTILGRYLSVQADKLRFNQGENGKPEIAGPFVRRTIHFNLSHSNGAALFAFARNHEIGVDIEYVHDMSEMEQIVERFFSIKEKEAFRALPQSQKREAFFKGWTCKEAIVKALGEGLSRPLDKFDVSLIPGESSELIGTEGDARKASRWSIQSLKPAINYIGAFAVNSNLLELKCWRWGIT